MNQTEFLKQKDAAARQMREMSAKAKPTGRQENTNTNAQNQNKNSAPFGLPIADFLKNSDTTLILGLLLILFSEDADKMLLFALIYILL